MTHKGWGESYPVLVAHPAETGYVNEGFLVEIPEWGGIVQLMKHSKKGTRAVMANP